MRVLNNACAQIIEWTYQEIQSSKNTTHTAELYCLWKYSGQFIQGVGPAPGDRYGGSWST